MYTGNSIFNFTESQDDYMKRLITISHQAFDQRTFQRDVVSSMQQLALAVNRKKDEDEDIDDDFQLKQLTDWDRANNKYNEKSEFIKLVCCQFKSKFICFYNVSYNFIICHCRGLI